MSVYAHLEYKFAPKEETVTDTVIKKGRLNYSAMNYV